MLSEVQTKSANYLRIIAVLKALRERGYINDKEYARAKKYYRKLTGADIVIADQRDDRYQHRETQRGSVSGIRI